MRLIYIGENFYSASDTYMSSIYELKDGEVIRSDWCKVQIALEEGREVHIRQANKREMEWAHKKLGRFLASR